MNSWYLITIGIISSLSLLVRFIIQKEINSILKEHQMLLGYDHRDIANSTTLRFFRLMYSLLTIVLAIGTLWYSWVLLYA
jgi:hypothetical protein